MTIHKREKINVNQPPKKIHTKPSTLDPTKVDRDLDKYEGTNVEKLTQLLNENLPEKVNIEEYNNQIENTFGLLQKILNWNDCIQLDEMISLLHKLSENFEEDSIEYLNWMESFKSVLLEMEGTLDYLLKQVKGEVVMAEIDLIKYAFLDDIEKLEPLLTLPDVLNNLPDSASLDYHAIVDVIVQEIKKGTKVSYKMIQELQDQIVTLTNEAGVEQTEVLDEQLEEIEKRNSKAIELIIKAIDMVDLIRNAAIQAQLSEAWLDEIDKLIENYLGDLEIIGIKEVETSGILLDGEVMQSIGTVPVEDANGLKKFEIYKVHERGFLDVNNGRLLRSAKVISVY